MILGYNGSFAENVRARNRGCVHLPNCIFNTAIYREAQAHVTTSRKLKWWLASGTSWAFWISRKWGSRLTYAGSCWKLFALPYHDFFIYLSPPAAAKGFRCWNVPVRLNNKKSHATGRKQWTKIEWWSRLSTVYIFPDIIFCWAHCLHVESVDHEGNPYPSDNRGP